MQTLYIVRSESADSGIATTPYPPQITDEKQIQNTGSPESLETVELEEPLAHGGRFWLLMLDLAAVVVFGALDTSMNSTALPTLANYFHNTADVIWYVVAFRFAQCAFTIQLGKVYKQFSVKRIFLLANAIYIVGLTLSAAAASPVMLIAGRAIAGAGYAGLNAGAMLILVQATPLRTRPIFLGIWSAFAGLATVAGPLIGGALTQSVGWRYCFYISLPIAGLTMFSTAFCFVERQSSVSTTKLGMKDLLDKLDLVSSLLLIPGLACLFVALARAGTLYSWNSGIVVGLLSCSGTFVAAFLYHQYRRGDKAAIPLRMVSQRSVLASFIFSTFLGSATAVLDAFLPTYYQTVHGYTPAQSGYFMLSILATATLGAVVTGSLTSRCGYYAPFMITAGAILVISTGLITTCGTHKNVIEFILYTTLFGLGYGIGSAGPSIALQTVLPKSDLSTGLDVLLLGSALGPAVANSVVQSLFTLMLSKKLDSLVPAEKGANLTRVGLGELLNSWSPSQAAAGRRSLVSSLRSVWYLILGLSVTAFLGVLALEWLSVKRPSTTLCTRKPRLFQLFRSSAH
ncbi:hypothetical protein DOTSEDRAFT_140148 [Dothistroma septosporum NZE10]|uniref:Major facilitator superfamily (MFS) profile domain-containing protein n=1 Tax=Dothistroma septosporum (strain NZE10 / CBS 128990) TaxID=675120 RepID=M2YI60_DOTSN|nr:hypothetical protein DOTSEDRAFT_140148 [Dothistroma septosporum NZE10]